MLQKIIAGVSGFCGLTANGLGIARNVVKPTAIADVLEPQTVDGFEKETNDPWVEAISTRKVPIKFRREKLGRYDGRSGYGAMIFPRN